MEMEMEFEIEKPKRKEKKIKFKNLITKEVIELSKKEFIEEINPIGHERFEWKVGQRINNYEII